MENASKALIIAGSVLIAILLISLVLFILKSTSGTTDQTQVRRNFRGTAVQFTIS